MTDQPTRKHPLEDPELEHPYALEVVLFDTLMILQQALLDLGLYGSIHETTENAMRTKVMHWREHFGLYLQHPKWEEQAS